MWACGAAGREIRAVRPDGFVQVTGAGRRSRPNRDCLFSDCDVDASPTTVEEHGAFHQREQRVVVAHANVLSRMPLGPTLADQDIAGTDGFATELLDSTSLSIGISPVTNRSLSLFVCHRCDRCFRSWLTNRPPGPTSAASIAAKQISYQLRAGFGESGVVLLGAGTDFARTGGPSGR